MAVTLTFHDALALAEQHFPLQEQQGAILKMSMTNQQGNGTVCFATGALLYVQGFRYEGAARTHARLATGKLSLYKRPEA